MMGFDHQVAAGAGGLIGHLAECVRVEGQNLRLPDGSDQQFADHVEDPGRGTGMHPDGRDQTLRERVLGGHSDGLCPDCDVLRAGGPNHRASRIAAGPHRRTRYARQVRAVWPHDFRQYGQGLDEY